MPLIDLDSVELYQTPAKADLAGERLLMASIGNIPVVYGEENTHTVPGRNGGWDRQLDQYDVIEVLDLTDSLIRGIGTCNP